MYDYQNFHFYWKLRVSLERRSGHIQNNHKECREFIKIWMLLSLKNSLQNTIKLGIFPPRLWWYICCKYIRNMADETGFYPPYRGASSPPSTYWASIRIDYFQKKTNRGDGWGQTVLKTPRNFQVFALLVEIPQNCVTPQRNFKV